VRSQLDRAIEEISTYPLGTTRSIPMRLGNLVLSPELQMDTAVFRKTRRHT